MCLLMSYTLLDQPDVDSVWLSWGILGHRSASEGYDSSIWRRAQGRHL